MSVRKPYFILFLLIALGLFAVPSSAYAIGLIDIGSIGADVVNTTVSNILDLVISLVTEAIALLGELIQAIINLRITDGGSVVYTAWRILRDFCNMAFIVALVLIAFGTIFDASPFSFLRRFSVYRGSIFGFLAAALLLNFSLAIGQTVVVVSDQAATIVRGILPENLGATLAGQLNTAQLATDVTGPKVLPVVQNVSEEFLSPSQQLAVQNWPSSAQALLVTCLQQNQAPPDECYSRAVQNAMNQPTLAEQDLDQFGLIFSPAALVQEYLTGGPYARTALSARTLGSDIQLEAVSVSAKLGNAFLLIVQLVSLLVVVAFMLIRIPAIWIILVLSPLAWTSLAFPGSKLFGTWWKQFMAWNIFAPLYLLVIYFGLFMIQQLNGLVGSFQPDDITFASYVSLILAYIMVAIVFVGGSAAVFQVSFAGGTYAAQAIGRIQGFLGIPSGGTAISPVARWLGSRTGVTAAYRGATAGIQAQVAKRYTKPVARRQEEIEARYKARFGDTSAFEQLQRKRVAEEKKKIEEGGVPIANLRKTFGSVVDEKGNLKPNAKPDAKFFAAGEALLKEGELSPKEVTAFTQAAGKANLGRSYSQSVREKGLKSIKTKAKEKEFSSDKEGVEEVIELMSDMTDDERDSFLKNLEKNQPLLRAKLAGEQKIGPIVDKKTGKPLTTTEILERNASRLSDEELLEIYDEDIPVGENVSYILNDKLTSRDGKRLLRKATDVNLRSRLEKEIEQRQREAKKGRRRGGQAPQQQATNQEQQPEEDVLEVLRKAQG